MNAPGVSVVVPTKNVGRTLRRCLESVRAQDHQPLELVVVDNFSTDDTFEIATEFADVAFQLGPERSAQRNADIERSTMDWILAASTTCLTGVDPRVR